MADKESEMLLLATSRLQIGVTLVYDGASNAFVTESGIAFARAECSGTISPAERSPAGATCGVTVSQKLVKSQQLVKSQGLAMRQNLAISQKLARTYNLARRWGALSGFDARKRCQGMPRKSVALDPEPLDPEPLAR